ncbi:MAG TPA: signal peptidase II, partial [Chthoniobacterales bacterium]
MKFIFALSLPLYLLDRVTKDWILHSVDPDQPVVVVPNFFHLVNITNTGAAFGSFKNNNAFFIGISCVALLFALILLLGRHEPGTTQPRSL